MNEWWDSYLEDLNRVGPVRVRVLPGFVLGEALREHVQVEDCVVLRIGNLALEQLHDAKEGVQRAADVHDCTGQEQNTTAAQC